MTNRMTTADAKVELVRDALCREIERQTGNMWPVEIGDHLYLVDAELNLTALAKAALEAPHSMTEAMIEALKAADKRLCELTPNFPPDVGPDMRDAAEVEETGHVVIQIRTALAMQSARPIDREAVGANGQAVQLMEIGGRSVEVDTEIAGLVRALNEAGYTTRASCSGHGHRPADIVLADGREITDSQSNRRLARALLLVLKAKLEAVASGVSIFDDEFLANIVMPDGKLVATHIRPRLAAAYAQGGEAPALLPDFSQ